jgi:hypothetical protein
MGEISVNNCHELDAESVSIIFESVENLLQVSIRS